MKLSKIDVTAADVAEDDDLEVVVDDNDVGVDADANLHGIADEDVIVDASVNLDEVDDGIIVEVDVNLDDVGDDDGVIGDDLEKDVVDVGEWMEDVGDNVVVEDVCEIDNVVDEFVRRDMSTWRCKSKMDCDCKRNEYVVMTDAKECFCNVEKDVNVEVDAVEVEEDDVQAHVVEGLEDEVQDVNVEDDLGEVEGVLLDIHADGKVLFCEVDAEEVVAEHLLDKMIANVASKCQKEAKNAQCPC